jgi:hypothetical protein
LKLPGFIGEAGSRKQSEERVHAILVADCPQHLPHSLFRSGSTSIDTRRDLNVDAAFLGASMTIIGDVAERASLTDEPRFRLKCQV